MKNKLHLLVIDPQNDFCDLPTSYLPKASTVPALPVPGAHQDMLRLAEVIRTGAAGLAGISVTIDSHHRLDIAHPPFWGAADGAAVAPFTQISAAQVRSGLYRPRDGQAMARVLAYLDALEAGGRYQLMVWPVHCEIGSWGQRVHADIETAFAAWQAGGPGRVNTVIKGTNQWTEHYSAIMAEVPDQDDAGTQRNGALLDVLADADRVYIAGEAGSHCVRATVEHIADALPAHSLAKLVLVTDCMSPVSGFEADYANFLDEMARRGLRSASAAEVALELIDNAAR